MLSQTLRAGVPLGIAYAIWAGVGVVLVALISWLVFRETLTLVQLAGIVLVIGGVTLLELGGRHPAEA
jgi:small multidrug resistance pump